MCNQKKLLRGYCWNSTILKIVSVSGYNVIYIGGKCRAVLHGVFQVIKIDIIYGRNKLCFCKPCDIENIKKIVQRVSSIILFDCEKWGSRRRITSSRILMSIKAFIFPHYSVCSFFWAILAYVCRTFKTHCQNIIKSFSCQFSFFGCLWILHRSLSFRKSFDVCNYIQCLLVVKRSMLRIALCLNATAGIVLPPFQSE